MTKLFGWLKKAKSHGHIARMYSRVNGHNFGRVFEAYQEILMGCNAMDYDDMLSMVSVCTVACMKNEM